mmetsp:Transcript_17894/g.17964  ORF Transcript_17894/g.17964 Transcript_17894/m.17964 type:complete len:241 (+) Transcript_17894:53-775(+)
MDPGIFSPDQNPSYQNYLAKQILANPTKYFPKAVTTGNDANETNPSDSLQTSDAYSRLNSLLDRIDSTKTQNTDEKNDSAAESNISEADSAYDWSCQFDPVTNLNYYYNHRTGKSQWERPEGYIDSTVIASGLSNTSTDQFNTSSSNEYLSQASFNLQTGRFSQSGTSSYWDKVGRPGDREGRQMSAFFDIQDLDTNRIQAKEKKKEILEKKNINWRQYKEERKKKRQKITNKWLYEDDT